MTYVLGVDFGTTWTGAAIGRPHTVEVAMIRSHQPLVPSLAHLDVSDQWSYGEEARQRAESEPAGLVRAFKRRFGDQQKIVLSNTAILPHEVAAGLLEWVVGEVAAKEGAAPDSICFTHPASWTEPQRELLRHIGSQIQLDAWLLSEPEAVAVHYGAQERLPSDSLIAVYDFGGGTFDATVLARRRDNFEILGIPVGVANVGGIDLDDVVMGMVEDALGIRWTDLDRTERSTRRTLERIRQDCTKAKEHLTTQLTVDIDIGLPGLRPEIRLTRLEVEERFRPYVEMTVDNLVEALRLAGVEGRDLHAVLLAGGSSRIPLVGSIIEQRIGRPVAIDVDPKLAVALGAARSIAPSTTSGRGSRQATPALSRSIADETAKQSVGRRRDKPRGGDTQTGPDEVRNGDVLPLWILGLVLSAFIGLVIIALLFVGGREGDSNGAIPPQETNSTSSAATSSSTTAPTSTTESIELATLKLVDREIESFFERTYHTDESQHTGLDCEVILASLSPEYLVESGGAGYIFSDEFERSMSRIRVTELRERMRTYADEARNYYSKCAIGERPSFEAVGSSYLAVCDSLDALAARVDRADVCRRDEIGPSGG